MTVRTYLTTMGLSLIALSATAQSETCDPEAARVTMETAASSGIVIDLNFLNDIPTVVVDPETWAEMKISARIGLFDVFECLIAGDGNRLAEAQAVDPGGKQLTKFDGVTRQLSIN